MQPQQNVEMSFEKCRYFLVFPKRLKTLDEFGAVFVRATATDPRRCLTSEAVVRAEEGAERFDFAVPLLPTSTCIFLTIFKYFGTILLTKKTNPKGY